MTYESEKEVNQAFLAMVAEHNSHVPRVPITLIIIKPGDQNDQVPDTRYLYRDFIDSLNKDGMINEELAATVSFNYKGDKP